MSVESVMPSNHQILCHPLLLLPSTLPSIRVFSNESALPIRWPKYWSPASTSVFPLHPNEKFPDAIRIVQQGINSYLKPVEDTFRALYVPAMQALIAKAREDAQKRAENPAPEATAPQVQESPVSGEGKDQPLNFGEIDPKTGLPKA